MCPERLLCVSDLTMLSPSMERPGKQTIAIAPRPLIPFGGSHLEMPARNEKVCSLQMRVANFFLQTEQQG